MFAEKLRIDKLGRREALKKKRRSARPLNLAGVPIPTEEDSPMIAEKTPVEDSFMIAENEALDKRYEERRARRRREILSSKPKPAPIDVLDRSALHSGWKKVKGATDSPLAIFVFAAEVARTGEVPDPALVKRRLAKRCR